MLIDKKFRQLLIPNMLMVFAASISEFVDAFIVARLLGSIAMAVVNLASPVLFLMMTVSALMGVGGSTVYTGLAGEHKSDEADRAYTATVITTFAVIVLVTVAMLISSNYIVNIFCKGNKELTAMAADYIYVLIVSLPVISVATVIFMFLPSAGMPVFGTVLILISNGANLCFDVVFIKYAGMGIKGAALATLCGYSLGLVVFFVSRALRYCNLRFARIGRNEFRSLGRICSMGSSSALSQLSFGIKFYFCNAIALKYGGTAGLVTLSVCFQLISITSIFVGGIGSSLTRIVAFLGAQMDYSSLWRCARRAYLLQLICSSVCFAVFFIFAGTVAGIYNISDPGYLASAISAIRIFSLCLVLRGVCITFMFYVQAIGKSIYASAISLVDGFVGIVPIALLLCNIVGISGLWWTFPVCSLVLALGILAINAIMSRRMPEKYWSVFLFEKDASSAVSEIFSVCSNRPDLLWSKLRESVTPQIRLVLESYMKALPEDGRNKQNDFYIRRYDNIMTVEARFEENSLFDWNEPVIDNVSIVRSIGLGMNTLQIKQAL